jgi:DNA polymerase elongation subunit (family B)
VQGIYIGLRSSRIKRPIKSPPLIKITKINEGLVAPPPPFSILYFEIHATSSSYNLSNDVNDPIIRIRARYQQEPEISFEGSEDNILKDFSECVLAKDPNILVSSTQHCRSITILDYLFIRMRKLGLDLQLARDKKNNMVNQLQGRVYLSSKSFHDDLEKTTIKRKNDIVESKPDSLNVFYE